MILTICTLGLFSPWSKVRSRNYLYSKTEVAGEQFEYHATPMQILQGRLMMILGIAFIAGLFYLSPQIGLMVAALMYLGVPWLVHKNAQFNASVTSYNWVRFRFTGSLKDSYKVFLLRPVIATAVVTAVYWLLSLAILPSSGMVNPFLSVPVFIFSAITAVMMLSWVVAGISDYMLSGRSYGKLNFTARLSSSFFFTTYFAAAMISLSSIALSLLMLGASLRVSVETGSALELLAVKGQLLYDFMFPGTFAALEVKHYLVYALFFITGACIHGFIRGRIYNHMMNHTFIGSKKAFALSADLNAAHYVWIIATNHMMTLFSLGLARPFCVVRMMRYMADCTYVKGDIAILNEHEHDERKDRVFAEEHEKMLKAQQLTVAPTDLAAYTRKKQTASVAATTQKGRQIGIS
ncbi:hypothetical protein VST7929_02350 [Vibrio stylophorae]|uniref:DUF898 domain-containing protein n=2 Tax=Vibrio stylophorae TaxID=659351 RepID=A0ABM8ZVS1_9VIBR|nr:hypothetical protein VST7929_02350 [Vibrio stylophorae]